jgi:hypothetical protein
MDKSTTGQVFNIADLEKEIEAEVRNSSPIRSQNSVDFAPRRVREPTIAIPDYVEHNEGATEIGKLSAEAVVREYEAAAKEIEAMGAELIERVRQCEAMTRDALAVNEELKETAQRYREEAKRVFVQIENCSLVTAEVRKTCLELKEKLASSATMDRLKPKKK